MQNIVKTAAIAALILLVSAVFMAIGTLGETKETNKCPYCLRGLCKTYLNPVEVKHQSENGLVKYSIAYFTKNGADSYTVNYTEDKVLKNIPDSIIIHFSNNK